jgi:hypothetical protein
MTQQVLCNNEPIDLQKKRKKKAIAAFIVMCLVFVSVGLIVNINREKPRVDIEVFYYSHTSRPIYLINDIHLNESTIANITNETFSLLIQETTCNKSIRIKYLVNGTSLQVSIPHEKFEIKKAIVHHKYHFNFQFLINSLHPDIQGIHFFGLNNGLNFSIVLLPNHTRVVSMDSQYKAFENVVTNERWFVQIWVIDPIDRNSISGHSFIITTRWSIFD